MFLPTILLKHPSFINRVLLTNFDTSDVAMQHLCITTLKYGRLYRTFYSVFVDFSRHLSVKMKNEQHIGV